MAADYRAGMMLAEIGAAHGITRERVRQILTKRFGITAVNGGIHVRAKRLKIDRDAARDTRYLKRWGCTFAQYLQLRSMRVTRPYIQQRRNARQRGISWELTLGQWWAIWQESSRWPQRGRGNGYMMCRKGDVGPYSVDNVIIERGNINSSEGSKKSDLPIGVRRSGKRFAAMRCVGGKKLRLGSFLTPDAAHIAYLAADPFREAA